MAVDIARRTDLHRRARLQDAVEYRILFAVCFVVFLPAALLKRVLPGRPRTGTRLSVLAEARSAAHATAGYAFMR